MSNYGNLTWKASNQGIDQKPNYANSRLSCRGTRFFQKLRDPRWLKFLIYEVPKNLHVLQHVAKTSYKSQMNVNPLKFQIWVLSWLENAFNHRSTMRRCASTSDMCEIVLRMWWHFFFASKGMLVRTPTLSFGHCLNGSEWFKFPKCSKLEISLSKYVNGLQDESVSSGVAHDPWSTS